MVGPYGLPAARAEWQVQMVGQQVCNIIDLGCLGSNPNFTTSWLHASASYLTSLCLSFLSVHIGMIIVRASWVCCRDQMKIQQ